MASTIKTTAVFLWPFELASFNETLPAGEYQLETDVREPVDLLEPGDWTSSVLVRLHPRESHPGLDRTLTVPLAELQHAIAKDKLTGKDLTNFFLEEMLDDPMICLVMQADGVSESEIRELYARREGSARRTKTKTWERIAAAAEDGREEEYPAPKLSRPAIGE